MGCLTISLLNLIKEEYKIISIIGMAKNSGKTVTLNHILYEAMEAEIQIGITSLGRDGENLDIVTETEKPRIFATEGTIIATATSLLSLGDANIEIIQVTDYRTPLGNVVIGRVKSSGYIQLAGPQSLKEIKEVAHIMLNLGAKFVIIDGALDRRSSAAPSIADATILATGAVLSRDINRAIEETLHIVNIFSLPQIEDKNLRQIMENLIISDEIAVINNSLNVDTIDLKTALGGGQVIAESLKEDSKYVFIPGSLVKNTIEELINSSRRYKNIKIVISDGTKVFINPKDWLRFMRYGIKVMVLHPINLIAITLNPYAAAGYYYEPFNYLERMKSYINTIPVMDLMLGGE